ncbi:MAG: Do family serine endopeptidase [Armatimonadota bacterium]|nr:Do family serine endopeptidase [bacterium]MCS7310406.1 Do family serine endopeptidase [Armatimonadota bacterium]MDW8291005.1 Do family serine endopeptidase [Armatimonadota bacterium]
MTSPQPRAWVFTLMILFSVALGAFLATAFQRPIVTMAQGGSAMRTVSATAVSKAEALSAAEAMESAFVRVAEEVAPAVVTIYARRNVNRPGLRLEVPDDFPFPFGFRQDNRSREVPIPMRGVGSGVIVRSDGYILTNDHVVAGAERVEVVLSDGRRFAGKVMRDFRSDIAVIKVDATGLPTARLGDSDTVRVGQWAIALGSPFGKENTMTVGVVSALGRREAIGSITQGQRYYPNLIQTDASINPGNSGGPLLNIRGEVIGINTAIESPTGSFAGIGFAVPINTARFVMEQLITRGRVVRGFLGVVPADVTPDDARRLNVRQGALITSVEEGSPAAQAGIQVEDVIVEYNGRTVRGEIDFRDMVARTEPGTTVPVKVVRNGREVTLRVKVGEAPDPEARTRPREQPQESGRKLGISIERLTPDLAEQFRLPRNLQGVVITEVVPGSAADDAGLQPGDVILRVDGQRVNSVDDVYRLVSARKSGEAIIFIVRSRTEDGNAIERRVRVEVP